MLLVPHGPIYVPHTSVTLNAITEGSWDKLNECNADDPTERYAAQKILQSAEYRKTRVTEAPQLAKMVTDPQRWKQQQMNHLGHSRRLLLPHSRPSPIRSALEPSCSMPGPRSRVRPVHLARAHLKSPAKAPRWSLRQGSVLARVLA